MSYEIKLSENEMQTLGWATNKGYFPEEAWNGLELKDGELEDNLVDDNTERTFVLPEHAAWSITVQRENDPDSLFSCIGGNLLTKLLKLEQSIVWALAR